MPLTKIQSLGITDGTIVNADINASAAIAGTKLTGVGKVLQVVQGTQQTDVSSTSSTEITTGLTASITPSSASNKILIHIVQQGIYINAANNDISFKIYKHGNGTNFSTGTNIQTIETYYGYTSATESKSNMVTTLLHSPSTTSNTAFTLTFNRNRGSGTVQVNNNSAFSSITLMEIAA